VSSSKASTLVGSPDDFYEVSPDSLADELASQNINAADSEEKHAIDNFFFKFVKSPSMESSHAGFLEHLPCMFNDINVENRAALRWAVQAAAYANIAKDSKDPELKSRAMRCYGKALSTLSQSLKDHHSAADDYVLMTVVVLDIFEVSISQSLFFQC
jgi:hypothetical protein